MISLKQPLLKTLIDRKLSELDHKPTIKMGIPKPLDRGPRLPSFMPKF